MTRVLLVGIVVVVVMVVAWTRDQDPGVREGPWHGQTSQGYPMAFVVSEIDGQLTVDEWQIGVDLRCEATGRLMGVGIMVAGMATPIADRRFAERHASPMMWNSWSGAFPAEDGALGSFGTVVAALIGEELEELRSEKCSATDLAWTARPGEADDEERAHRPVDLKLRVDRDGRVTRIQGERTAVDPRPHGG